MQLVFDTASAIGADAFHEIIGTEGDDTLTGTNRLEHIEGLGGDDLISGGGGFDDIHGDKGADTIDGGDGNDQLFGGKGDDLIQGGAGVDEAAYYDRGSKGPLIIDLVAGTADGDGIGHDTLVSIEDASGGKFADVITGDGQANTLLGYAGDDVLAGGDGSDQLVGDNGNDTLVGGGGGDKMSGWHGLDTFVYLAVSDSIVGAADLVALDKGDSIDFSAIDADTTQAGDQAFHRVDHLSGHAGELSMRYNGEGLTMLLADVDGDGQADMKIVFLGDTSGFHHFVL